MTVSHRSYRRAALAGVLATALAATGAVHGAPQSSTGLAALAPSVGAAAAEPMAVPEGVKVVNVEWQSTRRAVVTIHSAAMNADVKVAMILPREWVRGGSDGRFPWMLMLDGLRAPNTDSGWTLETNIDSMMADKNTLYVLPIGGEASFYTDWKQPDNGKHYMYETFFSKELPAILANDWRADLAHGGVIGLSMGGTSAMFLAQRYPEMFSFVGSFSGYLDLSSFGMPMAVGLAMRDVPPGYDAQKMWGPYDDPAWKEHSPVEHVDQLKGKTLYVSAGSGNTGPYDQPSGIPGVPTNYAGYALEILSRMTSQTFADAARRANVPVVEKFRPSGTHSWPYWQFELGQAWPYAAKALGTEVNGPRCSVGGDIGKLIAADPRLAKGLNGCITGEYPVRGGVMQDFRGGRVLWSPTTGALPVFGAIGGTYQAAGGPESELALPVSPELTAPDGVGRFQRFQGGIMYWTPTTGAHPVKGEILKEYGNLGYERTVGYPISPEIPLANGSGVRQEFQNGTMYYSPETGAHFVTGAIRDTYNKMGADTSPAGLPTSNEIPLRGGAFSQFQNGNIYWSPLTNAQYIPYGEIFDAWGREGYENGRLGYPTGPQTEENGVRRQPFQRGVIEMVNGKAEVKPL